MRYFNILLTLLLLFGLSNCAKHESQEKKPEVIKEELLKTIQEFNKAFQNGNVNVLGSMITENYLHTNGSSKSITKKDWLNYLRKREKEIESGTLEVISYEMDEVKIEFYDNAAIVTGRVRVSNKRNEEVQKNEYRITNIWVNKSGNWKRAGFHDGKIE